MKTPEIGLSLYQPICETCFSGYVKVQEGKDRLIVGIEVVEQFESDAILEIVLLSDSDDCMVSPSELYRTKPLTKEDLEEGSSLGFVVNGVEGPYFCIWYVVSGGGFTKGKLTARISGEKKPWFVTSIKLVEVSGTL